MSELTIEFPTDLRSMSEARSALERELSGLFPSGLLESRWEGDTLHIAGPGAQATVTLEEGRLVGRGTLRPPASLMREMIEGKVKEALRRAASQTANG